jgi:hypothetical protein
MILHPRAGCVKSDTAGLWRVRGRGWRDMEPEDESLVWQFTHIEGDSPLPMSADGFLIRFESYHGHISMLLEITEHTRKEDLMRGGWSLIAQWQDRLRKWHAKTESEGQIFDLRANRTKRKEWLLREMLKMKQAGKSWRQIAEHMNGYIERELQGHAENIKRYGKDAADFRNMFDVLRWQNLTGDWWPGLYYARDVMLALGMPTDEAGSWCSEGLQNLLDGNPAYLPDGAPITPERVREQLRHFLGRGGGKNDT